MSDTAQPTMRQRSREAANKIAWLKSRLEPLRAGAIRLRGIDWFAWATAGGDSAVLHTTDQGIAEILVTGSGAYVLTDEIEAQRLTDEEVPSGFEWHVCPWAEMRKREHFVAEAAGGKAVFCDWPRGDEVLLPEEFVHRRLRLCAGEQQRYREVGRLAAHAMSEVLGEAHATWTEFELAGAGAEALWARGLHPALVLAAGENRLPRYRHPTPSRASLDSVAMLVFCARGHGLYANLTRFVQFGAATGEQRRRHAAVRGIEAAALQACHPGSSLADVYDRFAQAYHAAGFADALRQHHQGGVTGYRAREFIATPDSHWQLAPGVAVAFNPSVAGAKIEDTFLLGDDGLENLTFDPNWPSELQDGRARPLVMEAG